MDRNWLGIISTILVVVIILWLLGGNKITCKESFWDKNKQVIEIKKD